MSLRVFIAGPFIDKDWDRETLQSVSASARLRVKLMEAVEALDHHVILGEHRGVAEMAEVSLPTKASVMLAELELARDSCEAIIIIPDSPGSFCELGSWAMLDDVCRKMLILGNDQHRTSVSYVSSGVFKSAQDEGAKLEWVNYSDISGSVGAAISFIQGVHDTALARKIKGHRG